MTKGDDRLRLEYLAKLAETLKGRALLAQQGDKSFTRQLASQSAAHLRSGKPMPPELNQWLEGALSSIAAGESADRAFAFKGKRGRQRKSYMELLQEQLVALSVRMRLELGKRDNPGLTVEQVCRDLVEELRLPVGEDSVKKYYYEHCPPEGK